MESDRNRITGIFLQVGRQYKSRNGQTFLCERNADRDFSCTSLTNGERWNYHSNGEWVGHRRELDLVEEIGATSAMFRSRVTWHKVGEGIQPTGKPDKGTWGDLEGKTGVLHFSDDASFNPNVPKGFSDSIIDLVDELIDECLFVEDGGDDAYISGVSTLKRKLTEKGFT